MRASEGKIRFGKRLLNDGWEFVKLPPESTREEAENAAWAPVTLPHDWLIRQADHLYESADAWYRRRLGPEETDAPTVLLGFDGVYMDCDILLNGETVCTHRYGYTAFQVNLSGKLSGKNDEILVHIRHRSPNSRWYSGSGIYRDVTLRLLPEAYLVPDSLYTVQEKRNDGSWQVRVEAEAVGTGPVYARMLNPEGKTAAEGRCEPKNGRVRLTLEIPRGVTWSPAHPALYRLEYGLGEQREEARIGLRTLEFNPEHGFFINGEHLKLKGVCLHHDLGALGAAFHPAAARRQLRIMQEMGANAVRTSHNPPARQLLDLCDEMGILVVDEILDMWERPKTQYDYARFFRECEAADVASWIRRDRNHPCVIMWSIGNEIYDMFAGGRGLEVTRMLRDQVRFHDPAEHAKVTFGSNYMPWQGAQRCAEEVGIPGYNYGEKLYAEHHAAHPDWVIYGSETASLFFSRGIYHFPMEQAILSDVDLQCSALGNSRSSWGASSLQGMIVDDLNTPYSMGQFVWSGMDYIGEPTPYHTRSCYFGQVDTAGFPKDSFYLFQSLWTDRPMIHLGVSWDWNPGQRISVPVMSNCASAELLLNGKSMGIRKLDRSDRERCMAMWVLPFEKGELRAVGYDAEGCRLCEDVRFTCGETAELRLIPESGRLLRDGSDLLFLQVEAVDAAGHPVENARDRLQVSVGGGGILLGLDNGDSTDPDGYQETGKRLFSGKLLMIIGASGRPEPVRIQVRSTAGLCARAEIPTTEAPENGEARPLLRMDFPASPEKTEIPVRRVEILPLGSCRLDPEHPEAVFTWKAYPENASPFHLDWETVTETGIVSPCAEVLAEGDRIRVRGKGDGQILLRALYGNAEDHPERISQMELTLQGFGLASLDPYEFVSAGLHDLQQGDIGAGNEKGIAFARDSGSSMIGFSSLDFGRAGTNRITLSIFALDSEEHWIDLYDGIPGRGGRLITSLRYQKPSIWNVYQEENWELPERLTGTHTICFEAKEKFHLKGFRFEKQSRAYAWQQAAEADAIYGDSFRKEAGAVTGIGNNVSLIWEEMDFGRTEETELILEGSTPLESCAVHLRMENREGRSVTEVVSFPGGERARKSFRIRVPGGMTRVTFLFLPGSRFDFYGYRFGGQEEEFRV